LEAWWVAKQGRPVTAVVLTDEERDTLQRWARRPKSAQALAQRCRIVLGCAAGKSNKEVATELGVSQQMVCTLSTVRSSLWHEYIPHRFLNRHASQYVSGVTREPVRRHARPQMFAEPVSFANQQC
jgi:DNA-binding CsgD family transcriptional regulator